MTERTAMIGIVIGLAVLNLVLMLRAVPPYDMLFAAHRQVGLGYSSLMVLASLGVTVVQAFVLRVVLRRLGVFGAPAIAPPRGVAPASPPAPAPAPSDGSVWLAHHDIHATVLRLDTRTGTRTLHPRQDAPAALSRGWFVEVEGAQVGLRATPEGPLFFLGDRSMPLTPEARAEVTPGRRRNAFRLRAGGQEIALSYAPPSDIHVGDMDAGAFHKDFFHWLAESLPSPDFHTYYTHPKPD